MDRRFFLSAAAASALTAFPGTGALADGGATRAFRILRGGDDIGRHELVGQMTGEGLRVDISIDIRVRFLGITAYRYTLENRELWSGGRLVRQDSTANEDGDRLTSSISRVGEVLEIDGTRYSGTAPLEAVTTSYFARPFVERRPWVSSQSGKPLEVDVVNRGGPRRWKVTGDLETALIYDETGEWVGCEFDAGGETARYELLDGTGQIAALWEQA